MFDFQLVKCSKILHHFFLFVKIHVMQIWRKTDAPQAIVCTNAFEGTAKNPTKKTTEKAAGESLRENRSTRAFALTVMFASSQNKVTLRVIL